MATAWRTFSITEPCRSWISALNFQDRNRIFELEPPQVDGPRLDAQGRRVVALDADPDRRLAVGREVGLPDWKLRRDQISPAVARNQEFALDFKTHAPPAGGTSATGTRLSVKMQET